MSARLGTNDRSDSAAIGQRVTRRTFGALEWVAPALGAVWAERLWFTVPKVPATMRRTRVDLPPGESFVVEHEGRPVRGTVWGSGPVVYLVHGWGGWGLQLAAFVPPLVTAGFRVVIYDAPSHGDSDAGKDGPRSTALPEMAAALRTVVEHFGPARAVVAHSIGAAATAHALRDGLTVDRLVFVAALQSFDPSLDLFARSLGFGPRTRRRLLKRVSRRIGIPIEHFDVAGIGSDLLALRGWLPPLLAIHDADDAETPYHGSVAISEGWPAATLRTTYGLGHHQVLWHPTLVAEIATFVRRNLMTADYANTIASAVGRFNAGDVEGYVSTLYAPDSRFHGFPDAFTPDRDGIAAFFRALIAAVPDARITPHDLLADGDRVAVRFTLTGTHEGVLLGAPATGRRLEVEGITVLRFENGLVVERWNRLDDLALLTQLGTIPTAA